MNCQFPLEVVDLGVMAYAPALAYQRQVNDALIRGEAGMTLILVEHEPVITVTHRRSSMEHLLLSVDQLKASGIDLQETDRGGDITWHGPGQLVVYPIIRLNPLGLNLGSYMRFLEQVVIDLLDTFHIPTRREQGATGVWVDRRGDNDQNHAAKICAMGVRVRKNTTLHGLALNVSPDLAAFDTIIPCGLKGRSVTSMKQLLGESCPDMAAVKAALVEQFKQALAARGDH